MYIDFEDYRPQPPRIPNPVSTREGVLLSIIVHLVFFIVLLIFPDVFKVDRTAIEARQAEMLRRQQEASPRFVFVQPRIDTPALKAPPRAEASDIDREARTRQRPPDPRNPLPFSRGNTPERVETMEAARARTESPVMQPEPAAGNRTGTTTETAEGNGTGSTVPSSANGPAVGSSSAGANRGDGGLARESGGSLGDTLRNLQKFVQQDNYNNPQGGQGAWGPSIQFDTKGVEFGPWIRRFIAQIKRNWFVPYAAMSLRGHTVITFHVHKNGSITDISVVAPSTVEAFNHSAFNALTSSNPTMPLPTEYPADKAFFTVTFFYNETPPSTPDGNR